MEFDGEVTDEDGTEFIGSVNIDLYEMNDEDGTFHAYAVAVVTPPYR